MLLGARNRFAGRGPTGMRAFAFQSARPGDRLSRAADELVAEEPGSTPGDPPRPLTSSFAPEWLRATTIKGSAEPFANLPPIAKLASEAALQQEAEATFGIGERVAGYSGRDTAPIPSSGDREYYWGENHASYWLSGLSDALAVVQQAARLGLGADARYFELGCASGRVVRHIAFQTPVAISCCDINKRHTEWVRLFLPRRINVFHNSVMPHLPIEDNSIDIATAFSVFTHIDDFEAAWLLELRRVLRPGGLAYVTVATDHTWERYKQGWIREQFMPLADKISDYAIDEPFFAGPLPRPKTVLWWEAGRDVYNAMVFHDTAYIRREWGRIFGVLDIIPEGHRYQDVVLLTK